MTRTAAQKKSQSNCGGDKSCDAWKDCEWHTWVWCFYFRLNFGLAAVNFLSLKGRRRYEIIHGFSLQGRDFTFSQVGWSLVKSNKTVEKCPISYKYFYSCCLVLVIYRCLPHLEHNGTRWHSKCQRDTEVVQKMVIFCLLNCCCLLILTTGSVRASCSRPCRVWNRIRARTSTVFPRPISSARIPPGHSTPARGNSRIKLKKKNHTHTKILSC